MKSFVVNTYGLPSVLRGEGLDVETIREIVKQYVQWVRFDLCQYCEESPMTLHIVLEDRRESGIVDSGDAIVTYHFMTLRGRIAHEIAEGGYHGFDVASDAIKEQYRIQAEPIMRAMQRWSGDKDNRMTVSLIESQEIEQ